MRTQLRRSPLRPTAALAGAVLAAACGSERTTEPVERFDPSRVLAEVAGQLGGAVVGATRAGGSSVAGGLAVAGPQITFPGGCAWQDAAQTFVCAPRTFSGLTLAYQYAPLDANGAVLREPTRANTAALRTASTLRGTLTSAAGGRTFAPGVDMRQEATIRGLLTATRTVDAITTATYDLNFDSDGDGVREGAFTVTQTTAGLVLPSGGARWPSAGTITTVIGGGAGLGESRTVMTFNGTSTVAIEVTSGGTTERCTLDLAATTPGAGLRCG